MYAVALAMFWSKHPEFFGLVNRFFPSSEETATRVLRSYLKKRPPELENTLKPVSYTHLDVYKRQEEILPNELLSREKMHQAPPHILLSNYAMLEYLLLRPDDKMCIRDRGIYYHPSR